MWNTFLFSRRLWHAVTLYIACFVRVLANLRVCSSQGILTCSYLLRPWPISNLLLLQKTVFILERFCFYESWNWRWTCARHEGILRLLVTLVNPLSAECWCCLSMLHRSYPSPSEFCSYNVCHVYVTISSS
jgi:hypothetical protein